MSLSREKVRTRHPLAGKSLLHATMAAICSVPTVRATAAPKVAVRRTSVRAAASGLRTQFGSSVKAFAPLGCVFR